MDTQYNQKFTDDFSIEHKITRVNELSRPHYHDDYELFLNLTPGLVTMVNNKYYHLNPGTLLIFNNMLSLAEEMLGDVIQYAEKNNIMVGRLRSEQPDKHRV